jgi:hypothetical protein
VGGRVRACPPNDMLGHKLWHSRDSRLALMYSSLCVTVVRVGHEQVCRLAEFVDVQGEQFLTERFSGFLVVKLGLFSILFCTGTSRV